MPSKTKTIEETYKKMDQHKHILHAPDTYIGSIEDTTCKMWIYNFQDFIEYAKKF